MTVVRIVRRLAVLLVLVALLPAAACNSSTAPSNLAAFSQTDLVVGSGPAAAAGNTLTVNYTGWLLDITKTDGKGLQFDTTLGREPFSFTLGTQDVIPGWDQGLVGMQVGGIRRLIIPPSLAYGGTRNGPIPPNSTLVFEIELLSVQ